MADAKFLPVDALARQQLSRRAPTAQNNFIVLLVLCVSCIEGGGGDDGRALCPLSDELSARCVRRVLAHSRAEVARVVLWLRRTHTPWTARTRDVIYQGRGQTERLGDLNTQSCNCIMKERRSFAYLRCIIFKLAEHSEKWKVTPVEQISNM